MKLSFSTAIPADAPALAALHTAIAEDLTRLHGRGHWSFRATERGVLFHMKTARVLVARENAARENAARQSAARDKHGIVGALNLQTKKPWAIDVSYFTAVKKALYLTGMAVDLAHQKKGIGRLMLDEAIRQARAFPADAIRLDAYDHAAGAGAFYAKCGFREVGRVTYRKQPLFYF
jgi:ribosomal protein S18 acetylase RimI-like enzyme